MEEKVKKVIGDIEQYAVTTAEEAEQFRLKFLSKKGIIPALFEEFKSVDAEQRRKLGKILNELKTAAEAKFTAWNTQAPLQAGKQEGKGVSGPDLTLPPYPFELGSRHPVSIVKRRITEIFEKIGYTVSEGPDIEDDWHNFGALNFPADHPARDMQDTFFISPPGNTPPAHLLRTHTSSVQVRVMEGQKPPIRTISPGRVYRNETISARAHCQFHQVEGLYIDKGVSFADLKQTLYYFVHELFGEKTGIRFRPSYFPFTEPSAEMDISCIICGGDGCNICKHSGWVEILGCGMVHPNVLDNCKIDSLLYTGFAFGTGVERIAMMLYGIKDLRLFYENDIRFLSQFRPAL
jgi:phenylalanyl-tRNA synthetase alpha chain